MERHRTAVRQVALATATALLGALALTSPARADDVETPTPSATATASPTSGGPSTTDSAGDTSSTPTPTATSTPTPTSTGTATPKPTPTSTKSVPPGLSKPTPTPTRSTKPSSPPPGDGESSLSASQLADQLAQAQALQAQLEASNSRLAAIQARMAQLSTQAATALQTLQTATRTEQAALADQAQQQQRLTELQAQAATLHDQLTQWARQAYVQGGELAKYQAYIAALTAPRTDQIGNQLYLLDYVGRAEDQALTEAETIAQVQQIVTDQANSAAQSATAARVQAEQANTQVQALLTQQKAEFAAEQAAQAGRQGQAALQAQGLANLNDANSIAARAQLAAAASGATTSGATCGKGVGKSAVKGFANGQIPRSALCPIWGAPGQLLRADAAAAFDTMSKAYAAHFGKPICVTDSYRSYSQQVSLYAVKPNLAARPGTSNHGWGVAVDLCGGIQSFGTVEHTWLFTHAPLFGWFHPSWAEPTGSRPEPWHWEFGG